MARKKITQQVTIKSKKGVPSIQQALNILIKNYVNVKKTDGNKNKGTRIKAALSKGRLKKKSIKGQLDLIIKLIKFNNSGGKGGGAMHISNTLNSADRSAQQGINPELAAILKTMMSTGAYDKTVRPDRPIQAKQQEAPKKAQKEKTQPPVKKPAESWGWTDILKWAGAAGTAASAGYNTANNFLRDNWIAVLDRSVAHGLFTEAEANRYRDPVTGYASGRGAWIAAIGRYAPGGAQPAAQPAADNVFGGNPGASVRLEDDLSIHQAQPVGEYVRERPQVDPARYYDPPPSYQEAVVGPSWNPAEQKASVMDGLADEALKQATREQTGAGDRFSYQNMGAVAGVATAAVLGTLAHKGMQVRQELQEARVRAHQLGETVIQGRIQSAQDRDRFVAAEQRTRELGREKEAQFQATQKAQGQARQLIRQGSELTRRANRVATRNKELEEMLGAGGSAREQAKKFQPAHVTEQKVAERQARPQRTPQQRQEEQEAKIARGMVPGAGGTLVYPHILQKQKDRLAAGDAAQEMKKLAEAVSPPMVQGTEVREPVAQDVPQAELTPRPPYIPLAYQE
tara:strand:- start:1145 stop:2854 length:1710 start_codon:yes stop_codon:yes gene_type:complete